MAGDDVVGERVQNSNEGGRYRTDDDDHFYYPPTDADRERDICR